MCRLNLWFFMSRKFFVTETIEKTKNSVVFPQNFHEAKAKGELTNDLCSISIFTLFLSQILNCFSFFFLFTSLQKLKSHFTANLEVKNPFFVCSQCYQKKISETAELNLNV